MGEEIGWEKERLSDFLFIIIIIILYFFNLP